MFCNECEYPAEDIYDLGEHMYEIHSSRYEGEGGVGFDCDICDDRFMTNLELIGHTLKTSHKARIPYKVMVLLVTFARKSS